MAMAANYVHVTRNNSITSPAESHDTDVVKLKSYEEKPENADENALKSVKEKNAYKE